MNAIKGYLLSVTGASMLVSLVLALLPKGKLRHVAMTAGSLVLVLAVLSPVVRLRQVDFTRAAEVIEQSLTRSKADREQVSREMMADIISERCQAYIWDKAAGLGVEVQVTFSLSEEKGYPYPVSAEVCGNVPPVTKAELSRVLEEDLGIPKEMQEWRTP